MAQPSYLSREGLENLKPELQHLRTVRRHDIAERIQQSRERAAPSATPNTRRRRTSWPSPKGASLP